MPILAARRLLPSSDLTMALGMALYPFRLSPPTGEERWHLFSLKYIISRFQTATAALLVETILSPEEVASIVVEPIQGNAGIEVEVGNRKVGQQSTIGRR